MGVNLNKVFIIGNLTRDPELGLFLPARQRLLSEWRPIAFGKNQQGEKQEEVQFHNIVVFGRQAEIVNQYLGKGSLILVEGKIQTRSWDGKDGSKQYRTEIVAERIQFGPKSAGSGTFNKGPANNQGIDIR